MFDFDLAILYEVENRALKQAVKRNFDRFPKDFMFKLSNDEWKELITKCDKLPANIKFSPATPYAFTEQGVAMLSSVLKSKKALKVNITIMRTFVYLRQFALSHDKLTRKLIELESICKKNFNDIYEVINYLLEKEKLEEDQRNRNKIGF